LLKWQYIGQVGFNGGAHNLLVDFVPVLLLPVSVVSGLVPFLVVFVSVVLLGFPLVAWLVRLLNFHVNGLIVDVSW
jgi:hypothetical protein